ncbi:MAG: high frequency lysogenization protein HflD [Hyphomicrobiales bacterium]|nr:MAG: high frequency lysogenization protein HflD [Hyphomicrobiales bacterium]
MEYLAILPLGVLIGMGHALEADHLAAVTTLQNHHDGRRAIIARGAIWGFGHTVSLFAACLAVFYFGLSISGQVEAAMEMAVGLMIAVLGGRLLWRMRRERLHIHTHEHDGSRHLHLHSHKHENVPHVDSSHKHRHKTPAVSGKKFVFSVGMMHGLAGSAGFLLLVSATADSIWQALGYLFSFGIGSIIGMAALTAIVSLPLGRLQKLQGWLPNATKAGIGIAAIFIGGILMVENIQVLTSTGV